MPDPARYKKENKPKYMQDCMHTTKAEGKGHDQSVAQCLSMWREKHRGKDATDYSKYLYVFPGNSGSEYYTLRIPKESTPPKVGDKLILKGVNVVVQSVSTPEDIAKGRGGPVARSMEENGIGWDVNCLPIGHKWLKSASPLEKLAGKLQKVIDEAKSQHDLPSVFLGGSCDEGNKWRKEVKEEFKDHFFFIDPYDPEWEAEENIYEELAAILNVDHVIFYKGGKGTEKEKSFMENADRDYKDFENLNKLKDYLRSISMHVTKMACISSYIRKIARLIEAKANHSYSMVGIMIPTAIANRIKKWAKEIIPDSEIFPDEGREDESHITVIYGLDSKDFEAVKVSLKDVKQFSVTLNKTSLFWNDKRYDVLKIDINSPALQKLHFKLREEFKVKKSFPEYCPHMTLAYLKKGYAEKYIDEDYSDISFVVDTLVFSDNENKKTSIKLNG
jgi:2'-5' RNA ligase